MNSVTSDHTPDSDARSHRDVTSRDALMLAMTELEFTRSDLALMFGVTRETVSRWAGGKMPIPQWVQFALDGIRWRRRSIAKVPPVATETPKPIAVAPAPKIIATPASKPRRAAKPIDCSPPAVPGVWRFGTFYPDA